MSGLSSASRAGHRASPVLGWLVRVSTERPRAVIGAWLALAALACAGTAALEFDPTTESILSQEGPAWQFYRESLASYGGDEVLVVALESERPWDPALLARVAALSEDLAKVHGVRRVDSLATVPVIRTDEAGDLRLDPALPDAARADDPALARVPELLARDRIAPRSLVSADGRVMAINLLLEDDLGHEIEAIIDRVRAAIAGGPAWVSGVPIFRTESNRQSEREIGFFVPITIAAVTALLYLAFRSRRAVAVSLVASTLGTLCTIGAMGASHTPLTFSTVILAPILLALGSAYTIHVLNATSGCRSRAELADGLREVARPVALSGLTTGIGFLGVALVRIAAIRDLGVFGAVGTLAVNAAALSLVPAALSLLPFDAPTPPLRATIGESWGVALVAFVARHRRAVIATWAALIAAMALGLPRIAVETDATRWFPHGSDVRDSYEAIRARLSGISPMNVVIAARDGSSLTTPEAIAAIDGLSAELASRPDVGKVLSIADPLRQIHAAFAGVSDAGLPQDPALIEQYLLLLSSVDRLADVLRPDRASANVLLRVDDNSSGNLLDVARSAEEWWRGHGPPGTEARATGVMFEFARAEDEIAMGQIRGLAASLLVVGALALVIFRALRVAAIAILPDAVPLAITFGFMGLAGIPLDAATVVVGCLALGIAVDDTIHLLAGFTEHPQHRKDPRLALEDTLRRVLPPTLLTTLAIAIGFGVLGLSGFALTRNFGLLTAATVGVALLTNLTLLPALLLGRLRERV
ncbi:MAG TPA: MMPL family transporter [Myxococcota bacterium]|nr:MMPL family transporter [Myxococcota bacterium]